MNDIKLDELPGQAKEIADLIGLEDTLRLVKIWGGQKLEFFDGENPKVGSRRDIITQLIGKKKATILFKHFDNIAIYLPRCASALKRIRDQEICTDSDKLTMPELVAKWAMSERQLWNILKGERSSSSYTAKRQIPTSK